MRVFLSSIGLAVWLLIPFAAGGGQVAQAATPDEEPAVRAVDRVLPAVVNINTERTIRRLYRDPYEDFFNQFYGGYRSRPREMRQKVQSLGSGFIVDPSGYIITNEHVVERADELKIQVTTPDGKTYHARYVTGDPESDLALLKIESEGPLPFISLEAPSPNRLGQSVLVVGNPLGYGHSVARGILSANNRSFTVQEMEFTNLVQTDAAINPGNSGGPLIDLDGKLVGVASAKMAYTPQGIPAQGIGFAIPASTVATKVEEFKKTAAAAGSNRRSAASVATSPVSAAKLGLTLQEMTPELAEALGVTGERGGVLISDVEPGSPAHRAGLTRGMIVYRVGTHEILRVETMEKLLAEVAKGAPMDLRIGYLRRSGQRGAVFVFEEVTLRAR